MSSRRIVIGWALALAALFGQVAFAQGQDVEDVDHEVETLLAKYLHAWNEHDMEAWASLFTADSDFVNRRGGWWHTREANVAGHVRVHEMLARRGVDMDMDASVEALELLAPGVALVHVRTVWPGMRTPAAEGPPPEAIMTWIVVESAGAWRIRAVQNTLVEEADPPLEEEAVAAIREDQPWSMPASSMVVERHVRFGDFLAKPPRPLALRRNSTVVA